MSQIIIGLTGGIGSGKTTVSNYFKEKGITIVDADVIAREVVEPGSPGLKAIVEYFGEAVTDEQGSLNRALLRERVFNNNHEKEWLNNLLHPMIREEMQKQCREASSSYVILSVPLLIENKLNTMVDRVLVVDCSEELQLHRAAGRDEVSREQIKRIMQSQCSREERLAFANEIIDNEQDLAIVSSQVDELHRKYLQIASSPN